MYVCRDSEVAGAISGWAVGKDPSEGSEEQKRKRIRSVSIKEREHTRVISVLYWASNLSSGTRGKGWELVGLGQGWVRGGGRGQPGEQAGNECKAFSAKGARLVNLQKCPVCE